MSTCCKVVGALEAVLQGQDLCRPVMTVFFASSAKWVWEGVVMYFIYD